MHTFLRGDRGLGDRGTVAALTRRPGGDLALPALLPALSWRLVSPLASDSRRSSPESSKPCALWVLLRPASTKPCFVLGIAGRVSVDVVASLELIARVTSHEIRNEMKYYNIKTNNVVDRLPMCGICHSNEVHVI